jgi:Protein of unknown function (DUF3365)
MTQNARRMIGIAVAGLLVAGLSLGTRGMADDPADPAVERARQQVKMLDDIYKTTVVAITDKYVHKETDLPAATVAMSLFEGMKQKGWHESRLIDATGHPYDEKNVAKSDFEKAAVKALLGGKDYYEQLVTVEGKPRLRAATPVPVVMKKCTMCHDHYKGVKAGVPIGILTYDVPVK